MNYCRPAAAHLIHHLLGHRLRNRLLFDRDYGLKLAVLKKLPDRLNEVAVLSVGYEDTTAAMVINDGGGQFGPLVALFRSNCQLSCRLRRWLSDCVLCLLCSW